MKDFIFKLGCTSILVLATIVAFICCIAAIRDWCQEIREMKSVRLNNEAPIVEKNNAAEDMNFEREHILQNCKYAGDREK